MTIGWLLSSIQNCGLVELPDNKASLVIQIGVYWPDSVCSAGCDFDNMWQYCDYSNPNMSTVCGMPEIDIDDFTTYPAPISSAGWHYYYVRIKIRDWARQARPNMLDGYIDIGVDQVVRTCQPCDSFADDPYFGIAATWYSDDLLTSGGAAFTTDYGYINKGCDGTTNTGFLYTVIRISEDGVVSLESFNKDYV